MIEAEKALPRSFYCRTKKNTYLLFNFNENSKLSKESGFFVPEGDGKAALLWGFH